MKKYLLLGAAFVCALATLYAHDDGHKTPKTLPPFGPHGGNYAKLTRHYAEAVVKGNRVTVYILERDIKYVAEDASRVSVSLKILGRKTRKLKLKKGKKSKGYSARITIPRTARRVYFHVRCKLDGKWERGRILHEPRR